MQEKYSLSKRARDDIKNIFRYSYQRFGEHQAKKYKAGLEGCLQLLAESPDLGRKCDEIRAGYRRHEHGRQIIFYRKRTTDIFVVRIVDARMDVENRLGQSQS